MLPNEPLVACHVICGAIWSTGVASRSHQLTISAACCAASPYSARLASVTKSARPSVPRIDTNTLPA